MIVTSASGSRPLTPGDHLCRRHCKYLCGRPVKNNSNIRNGIFNAVKAKTGYGSAVFSGAGAFDPEGAKKLTAAELSAVKSATFMAYISASLSFGSVTRASQVTMASQFML